MNAYDSALAERMNRTVPQEGKLLIWWLGQSGFLIRSQMGSVIVDPYLSTTLEDATHDDPRKQHVRMMPVCVDPAALKGIDFIACTHAHRDHYDPATIRALRASNPQATLIGPLQCTRMMERDGFSGTATASPETTLSFGDLRIYALPSAHNDLEYDAELGYPYLGYTLDFGGLRIYHAGDCMLYPGLVDSLRSLHPSLAILPINGSSQELIDLGFKTNMSYSEALTLCKEAEIPNMIPCHYDMFTINTEQVGRFVNYANIYAHSLRYWVPVIGEPCYFPSDTFCL